MTKPVYISVDLEFTDTDINRGRILQVGMAASDGEILSCLMPVNSSTYVSDWVRKHLNDLVESCVLLDLRNPERYTPPSKDFDHPSPAMTSWLAHRNLRGIADWVYQRRLRACVPGGELPPAVFVGYCIGLDWALLARDFSQHGIENPFHYESLDIAAVAFGKLGTVWGERESVIEEKLGMEPMAQGLKHDALEDAKHQLEMFLRLADFKS